jgi:hypothetical protein
MQIAKPNLERKDMGDSTKELSIQVAIRKYLVIQILGARMRHIV